MLNMACLRAPLEPGLRLNTMFFFDFVFARALLKFFSIGKEEHGVSAFCPFGQAGASLEMFDKQKIVVK